jgi:hypothetical protein
MSPPPPPRESWSLPAAVRRELVILAGALAFGVVVVPPLLWLAGTRSLGPYAGGGPGALVESFFRGLASASLAFWVVALAPYLITLVVRALVGIARGFPAAD